jgi:hypothetical protein
MLAPLAASLFRYGACPLLVTLERCLFSKTTTTMWSGRGTAALGFLFAGRRNAAVGSAGPGVPSPLVLVGSAGATVGEEPLEGAGAPSEDGSGAPVDGGSATVQAVDAISNIPAAAQADRGKTRTRNPLQT